MATPDFPITEYHAVLEALEGLGATQRVLGDVLRQASVRMSAVEAMAADTNERVRSIEAAIAEIRAQLAGALTHAPAAPPAHQAGSAVTTSTSPSRLV